MSTLDALRTLTHFKSRKGKKSSLTCTCRADGDNVQRISTNHNNLHLCNSLAVESGTFLTTSVKRTVTSQPSISRPKKNKQCNIVQLYFAEAPMLHCIHVPQFQPANALRGHLYQKVNKRETLQYHEWHEEANISNISNMLFMIVHVQLSECTLCAVSSALPHFQDVPWSLLERCRLQCHWPSRPSNRSWSWPAELPPPELMITPISPII